MFFSVSSLPSTISFGRPKPSFDRFAGVGSEVARLRASHRPPLKLYVRFSRIQLSRKHMLRETERVDYRVGALSVPVRLTQVVSIL
jgi:hypothetical protein